MVKIIDIGSMKEDRELEEKKKELLKKKKELLKKKETKLNLILQHLKGNLVTRLSIHESHDSQVYMWTRFSTQRDGIPYYSFFSQVDTGVFDGVELSDKLAIKGNDYFEWVNMRLYNGPKKNKFALTTPSNSKLLKAENGEVMLWNGTLPYCIYSDRNRPEAELPDRGGAKLYSQVIVIGDKAVTKIFGLKPSRTGKGTEWIYRSLLKKQGLDPYKVLPYWDGISVAGIDEAKFTAELQGLEEKVGELPEKFFGQYINTLFQFDKYLRLVDAKETKLNF